MAILPRISGRIGQPIDLNVIFYRNGIPTDPYAIIKVQIYHTAVQDENLVAEIPILPPTDPNYPSPLVKALSTGGSQDPPGEFHLLWTPPKADILVPNIFFDQWSYLPDQFDGSNEIPLDDSGYWQQCCNEFWLYPEGFNCDTGLETIQLGFEALDVKLWKPEVKTIQVGLMPLPLYDFDYNKIAPLIPQLQATITIETENCEVLVQDAPMRIGIRQGTFRSNPFVLQYLFNTSGFLKGSYRYRVTVRLPNGETRVSPDAIIQIN